METFFDHCFTAKLDHDDDDSEEKKPIVHAHYDPKRYYGKKDRMAIWEAEQRQIEIKAKKKENKIEKSLKSMMIKQFPKWMKLMLEERGYIEVSNPIETATANTTEVCEKVDDGSSSAKSDSSSSSSSDDDSSDDSSDDSDSSDEGQRGSARYFQREPKSSVKVSINANTILSKYPLLNMEEAKAIVQTIQSLSEHMLDCIEERRSRRDRQRQRQRRELQKQIERMELISVYGPAKELVDEFQHKYNLEHSANQYLQEEVARLKRMLLDRNSNGLSIMPEGRGFYSTEGEIYQYITPSCNGHVDYGYSHALAMSIYHSVVYSRPTVFRKTMGKAACYNIDDFTNLEELKKQYGHIPLRISILKNQESKPPFDSDIMTLEEYVVCSLHPKLSDPDYIDIDNDNDHHDNDDDDNDHQYRCRIPINKEELNESKEFSKNHYLQQIELDLFDSK